MEKFNEIIKVIVDGFKATFIEENRYLMFLEGLGNTLLVALFATLVGVVLGVLIAIVKTINKENPRRLVFLNGVCEAYTTIIRGTPVVVQLLIIYNVIFSWSTQAVPIGIIGFGLNSGAYVAEIIRAGINAVDKGQMEAGRSLGLSWRQTMVSIILPQAVKNVLPAIGNEFISLLKETSVIGYLGVRDLTKAADRVISRTMNVYYPYIAIALIYLAIVCVLNYFVKKLEKRLNRNDEHKRHNG